MINTLSITFTLCGVQGQNCTFTTLLIRKLKQLLSVCEVICTVQSALWIVSVFHGIKKYGRHDITLHKNFHKCMNLLDRDTEYCKTFMDLFQLCKEKKNNILSEVYHFRDLIQRLFFNGNILIHVLNWNYLAKCFSAERKIFIDT